MAVMAFKIVTLDCPELHLPCVKHLFKQKLWNYVVRKLEHQMNELTEDHVTTLILIMNILPLSVLKIDVQKSTLILMKALSLKDSQCVLESLNILNKLIEYNEYLSAYVSNIVQKLLGLTKHSLLMVSAKKNFKPFFSVGTLRIISFLNHTLELFYFIFIVQLMLQLSACSQFVQCSPIRH